MGDDKGLSVYGERERVSSLGFSLVSLGGAMAEEVGLFVLLSFF